jgi:hypothetical protein
VASLAGLVRQLEAEFRIRADQEIFEVETLAELADYIAGRQAQ